MEKMKMRMEIVTTHITTITIECTRDITCKRQI